MSELLMTGVAVAPVIAVLVLLALRVPSLTAGAAGLVAALLGAVTAFRPDDDEVLTAVAQLGPTVLEVALILLGGVLLATALSATGSRDHIAGWLERIGSGGDRVPAILLLVFGLTPFMESVTGFGLGVVITAPLLVRMGLSPVKAVVVGLLGLVLVPWGSLGPGTLVAAELGGQDVDALGYWSALLSLPVFVVSMMTVLVVVTGRTPRHRGAGRSPVARPHPTPRAPRRTGRGRRGHPVGRPCRVQRVGRRGAVGHHRLGGRHRPPAGGGAGAARRAARGDRRARAGARPLRRPARWDPRHHRRARARRRPGRDELAHLPRPVGPRRRPRRATRLHDPWRRGRFAPPDSSGDVGPRGRQRDRVHGHRHRHGHRRHGRPPRRARHRTRRGGRGADPRRGRARR
ncbi:putative L-lactate permease, partial [Dietzia cinnamea P4]